MDDRQPQSTERRVDRIEDRQHHVLEERLPKIEKHLDELDNLRWRFTAIEGRVERLERETKINGLTNGRPDYTTIVKMVLALLATLVVALATGRAFNLGGLG